MMNAATGHPAAADPAVAAALEAELRGAIRGEVRFDRLTRAIYATDASLYQIFPLGVVLPRCIDDVVATVNLCRERGLSIVPRGAGTGIAGGAVGRGVQIDFSKYLNRISAIDPQSRTVQVEPGVVLDDLNAALSPCGLHFPPDVATASRATIGGMIANNSCGAHSVCYGRTVDYVVELTVVLSDGSVVTWPHHPYADLPAEPARPQGGRSVRGGAAPAEPWRANREGEAPAEPPPAKPGSAGASPARSAIAARIEHELDRIRAQYRDEVFARYPRVMRRNGGYALDRLCTSEPVNPATIVCGSEGTLCLVVGATLRLTPPSRCKALIVAHFDAVLDALAATPLMLQHRPAAVELVDKLILAAGAPQVPESARGQFLSGLPAAVLICELYDDDADELRRRMQALETDLAAASAGYARRVVCDANVQQAVWDLRNRGFGLLMSRPGDRQPYEFIEDAAVDPSRLRDYIAELDATLAEEGVTEVGHYAHASVGVIHVRPVLNLKDPADVQRLRRIAQRTTQLVLKYGGAMTGEHGDGLVRSEWLETMYGPTIVRAFREVKQAFDPHGLFNPGKIVDPLPMDENLRHALATPPHPEPQPGWYGRPARPSSGETGETPRPRSARTLSVQTHLDFARHGGMAGLAGMCSGVGQCRQKLVGTMCPSYMATLDEKHTTRARANALRIALSDGDLLDGLDDPALDEVMELCLLCKACRTECPTGVDMARLKCEWLAHRNATRGVSRSPRFFATAARHARLGSRFPRIANVLSQNPLARRILEWRYGLDRRVPPPRFATPTFRRWFASRTPAAPGHRGRVVYFVDTWTDCYWPQVGIAAVRLLEAARFEVLVPELECCGRPLISKGFLAEAAELARRNVERLADLVEQGAWVVGSEPSCLLTLIDEYPQLVRTLAARKLAGRTMIIESLLARLLRDEPQAIAFAPPQPGGVGAARSTRTESSAPATSTSAAGPKRILYHGHCHLKALVGTADVLSLLNSVPGWNATEINSGCCGMAGSFGHERAHHDVARAIGEQRLFPAVRNRGDAAIAVSGFSCREQIAHHTGLAPWHVLELVAQRLGAGQRGQGARA